MGQGQTVSEAALFDLHTRVLQHTMVLGGRKHQGPEAGAPAGEDQPVESHGDGGPQAAFAVVDPEDQHSLGRERRTAPLQQRLLIVGGQILQDIQNQNQAGWWKIETTHVSNAQVRVQGAESLTSDCDAMRIQVATYQAPAAVAESCKT